MINKNNNGVFSIKSKLKFIVPALVLTVGAASLLLFKSGDHFKEIENHLFKHIDTYREVQSVFDACDKNTLITFDVDDTLVTPRDVILRNIEQPFLFKMWMKIKNLFRDEKKLEHARSIIWQQSKCFVFDPDIVHIIQQLRRQGCMVIALTSMLGGSFGVIKSMAELRAQMLKNLGIDFSGQFQDVHFTDLPARNGQYSVLYKGILCANPASKGAALHAFLNHFHLKPARIVSFDDSCHALASLAHECTKKGITFTGYQILGASKLPEKWSTRRALLQDNSLMKHGRWLSDKEADAILAGKGNEA